MTRKSKKTETLATETIVDLGKKMTDNSESLKDHIIKLEKANFGLNETVNKFITKCSEYEAEISHLKSLLFSNTPVIMGEGLVPASDEEVIAEMQLRKISENARIRELTLDEIKKYDLLVKNKRLAQGNATDIPGKEKLPAKSKDQLLQIASSKKSEEK